MKSDDPVTRGAERAIAHLSEDHVDALLEMAQAFGGQPEATAARCLGADRTGLDLLVTTAAAEVPVRVEYEEPIDEPAGLRKATVKLAHAARAALAETA